MGEAWAGGERGLSLHQLRPVFLHLKVSFSVHLCPKTIHSNETVKKLKINSDDTHLIINCTINFTQTIFLV